MKKKYQSHANLLEFKAGAAKPQRSLTQKEGRYPQQNNPNMALLSWEKRGFPLCISKIIARIKAADVTETSV